MRFEVCPILTSENNDGGPLGYGNGHAALTATARRRGEGWASNEEDKPHDAWRCQRGCRLWLTIAAGCRHIGDCVHCYLHHSAGGAGEYSLLQLYRVVATLRRCVKSCFQLSMPVSTKDGTAGMNVHLLEGARQCPAGLHCVVLAASRSAAEHISWWAGAVGKGGPKSVIAGAVRCGSVLDGGLVLVTLYGVLVVHFEGTLSWMYLRVEWCLCSARDNVSARDQM